MSTSYTLIDYFNGFQQLKRIKRFSAGVQSTYFAILAEFNLRRFPAELELSTRDLKSLAGLKSVSSAHEARNILKNNKLVDFHTKNGISTYSLGTEHLPNTYRTPTEHYGAEMPNASRTPHALVYDTPKPVGGETETWRRERDTVATTTAPRGRDSLRRVRAELGEGATTAAEPAAQTAAGRQTCGKDANDGGAYAPLHERTLTLRSPENEEGGFDAFIDDWSDSPVFCKLDFELISELKVLSEVYGLAALRQAMTAAKRANGKSQGVSFDFFKAVLERQQKPDTQPLKGGEKSGGQSTIYQYELPPADNGDEPWAKY